MSCSGWPLFCSAERVARCSYRHWNQRAQLLCGLHCLFTSFQGFGEWGSRWKELGFSHRVNCARAEEEASVADVGSADPPGFAALLQLSLCVGLMSSRLPLVTSVTTWRGTDFPGLGLSTECTISQIPLKRAALPSLSCALGWWRAFPHAETSSQLQAVWNAPKIPSLLRPASVPQKLFRDI